MAHDLELLVEAKLSDVAIAMAYLYEQNKDDIHAIGSKGKHYKRLKGLGEIKDLEYCYKSGVMDVVPVYTEDGRLVKFVITSYSIHYTKLYELLVIFLFGGETIRGFVFALMLGVVVGTYSYNFV